MPWVPAAFVHLGLPGAPNPWSGEVVFLDADQVRTLDMKAMELMHVLEGLGIGAGKH